MRVAAIYSVAGILYILGSDWLVEHGFSSDWRPGIQSIKGIAFVLATGAVLGLTCRHFIRQGMAEIIAVNSALEEIRNRFQLIADNVNEVLWIGDPRDRSIQYVSPAYQTIWGREIEPLYGDARIWIDAIHPEDRELVRKYVEQRTTERNVAEYRITLPDGTVRWIEDRGFPVFDANGEVYRVVGVARDITEQKKAVDRIAELQWQFENVIEAAPVGILVHRNFAPLLANETLAEMFGYSGAEEILNLPDCLVLFPKEERDRIARFNRQRLVGEDVPQLYDLKGQRRDGSIIELENRVTTFDWEGSVAVCSILLDVTEQRDIERQLRQAQRLEAVGQLTGGIAHDFNNLLTIMLGSAEQLKLRLQGRDTGLHALVETIQKAAERGSDLTQSLLSYSRRQLLAPVSTDVSSLVEGMRDLLERALGEHIEVGLDYEPDLEPAFVDEAQLESAILNLCLNARDAMPEGGRLTIEVGSATLDQNSLDHNSEVAPGQYVRITVADTGHGMSSDVVQRAFEPFFTTKEVGQGTGLGLSMVLGFVKQSNGHLEIESQVDQGTTIRLYLPRTGKAVRSRKESKAIHATEGRGEHVLLVEDDAMVRDVVSMQFSELGYRVSQAENGAKALQMLEKNQDVDLLFTDLVMSGGMDGRQLAAAVRKIRPDMPILFTSGYPDTYLANDEVDIPILNKPHHREELAQMVRSVLDNSLKKTK